MASVKQLIKLAEENGINRRCRNRELVYKRYYLFSELRKELTLEAIARMFEMNHSTVLYGLKQHEMFMKMNDRIYINTVADVFEKVNEFNLRDLAPGNVHMKITHDQDSFVTMELYLHTKHADLYRDNQGVISREVFKEML
jgi:hypothetical protein